MKNVSAKFQLKSELASIFDLIRVLSANQVCETCQRHITKQRKQSICAEEN